MSDKAIQFGFGRANINPSMPISLAGYFNIRMWKTILDDLEVRALVLKQEETITAIVQFDLVTVSQELAEAFYKEISDIQELSPDKMIITATHTHTAPEVRGSKPGAHPDFVPFAAKQAAKALREAMNDLHDGTLLSGKAEDHRFSFNRRYWMKNGEVITNPGKLNPAIERPEGEVDHDIPLLGIAENGKLKVLLANIVNHTDTIGGSDVSADWAGFFIKSLEKQLGEGSMVFPLIGCAGNINHFDVSTDMDQTCYAEAKRIGEGYADSVSGKLKNMKPIESAVLEIRSKTIQTSQHEISKEELEDAEKVLQKYEDVPDPLTSGINLTSEDLAQGKPIALKYFAKILKDMASDNSTRSFQLVGIFLDDTVIASLPCEPFVEIGLEIKRNIFKGKNAMVVSHSNGTGNINVPGGYIPNTWNYGRGGYETTPRSNQFSVKTSEKLLEAWREIAQ
jgi:hypothetical protein